MDDDVMETTTALPPDLSTIHCCCGEDGIAVGLLELTQSIDCWGVMPSEWTELSTDLPPSTLSDLVESLSDRLDADGAKFSAVPWETALTLSASEHTFQLSQTYKSFF